MIIIIENETISIALYHSMSYYTDAYSYIVIYKMWIGSRKSKVVYCCSELIVIASLLRIIIKYKYYYVATKIQ